MKKRFKMDISVIVPALNEERSVVKTIKKIRETVPNSEIIFVDDGSTDRTYEIAKKQGVTVIRHEVNLGYGASLVDGFSKAKTPYVAFLDADLTYNPKYIPILLDIVKKEKLDCAWGNRFGKKKSKMPFIRKVGNKMLIFIFALATGRFVSDVCCGERVLSKKALEKIDYKTFPERMSVITSMTKRIVKRKLKYRIIPIEYSNRRGSSKLNVVMDFLKMIISIFSEK